MQTDPIGYTGIQFNLYVYATNDPTNATDPTGLDVLVELKFYILGSVGGSLYGHSYVVMTDTQTGQAAIARAGPNPSYGGGFSDASRNRTYTTPSGETSKLEGRITERDASVDSPAAIAKFQKETGITGQGTVASKTIPGSLSDAVVKADNLTKKINDAGIPYRPRFGPNSNSYAYTVYSELTNTPLESGEVMKPSILIPSQTLSGSQIDLRNTIGGPGCLSSLPMDCELTR